MSNLRIRERTPAPRQVLNRFAIAAVLLGAACVTVNVNFPESAVQKATDDYVKDLYRSKERGKSEPAASATPATAESAPEAAPAPAAKPASKPASKSAAKPRSAISLLFPEAYAADVPSSFSVSSDKALAVRDRLASRLDEVLIQKRAGVLGETNDGMLVLKDSSKVKKLLLKKIEKTVEDENADRKELYADVVKTNGMQDTRIKDVQRSFSRSFQAESPSGTWVQDADGKWSQKP